MELMRSLTEVNRQVDGVSTVPGIQGVLGKG